MSAEVKQWDQVLAGINRHGRRAIQRQMKKRKGRTAMSDQPEVAINQPSAGPLDLTDVIHAQRTALKAMEQFANAAAQLAQAQQQIAALQAKLASVMPPPNPPEMGNGKLPPDEVASAVDAVVERPTAS